MPERGDWCVQATAFLVRHRSRLHGLAYILLLALARPNDRQDALAFLLLLLGFPLRVWAVGSISKDRVLCTWGPYRYTRNPLYLANLLIGAGLVVNANHWLATATCAILLGVTYCATIGTEERQLRELFGEAYIEYCRVTPRLVPCFRPRVTRCAGTGFEWRRALTAGLVPQTVALVLLMVCMESKEEYLESRHVAIPMTLGIAPVDLTPDADGPEFAGLRR